MKLIGKTFAAAIAITALTQAAVIAAEPSSTVSTPTPKTAPLSAPSPIEGVIGPNDGLTTPAERTRMEQERQDRDRNPNAMNSQMNQVEQDLDIKGKRP